MLLFFFFGLDKIAAIFRQLIIARQFGLSVEVDVFNIANNLPDMLYTLISGGALSLALIPVMTGLIDKEGRAAGWKLFSSIANLSFLAALVIAIFAAIFAEPIVSSQIGIAPGFKKEQQQLVVNLMRLNLIATIIFSISGLVMGGLQANEHFLTPAMAPVLYNIGQIIGAVILAPDHPYHLGKISLPCFGLGVYGLVYGVLIGALLHLLIQIPDLVQCEFHWSPKIEFKENSVQKVLRMLGPRILSVFFVQMIFIVRDNLASRLSSGSVSALSYGYMFQQLPETLIGTALGTAILPSISLFVSQRKQQEFSVVVNKASRIGLAFALGSAAIMAAGMEPVIEFAFKLNTAQNMLLLWTLRGFLVGLAGHCLLEVANRAFYAQQNAIIPLIGTIANLLVYIILGMMLYSKLDAPGISLTDSIAFTLQAAAMMILLACPPARRLLQKRPISRFGKWISGEGYAFEMQLPVKFQMRQTILRSLCGSAFSGILCYWIIYKANFSQNILVKSILGMGISLALYLLFIIPEIKDFIKFDETND